MRQARQEMLSDVKTVCADRAMAALSSRLCALVQGAPVVRRRAAITRADRAPANGA